MTLAAQLPEIEARVDARMQRGHWPGVAIGIERGGDVLTFGRGLANVEHDVPTREDTVFRIGSLTKQFTAAMILQLCDSGKLALDDDVRPYVPELPMAEHRVTIEHLLTHTSGLTSYTALPEFWQQSRQDLSHEQLLALLPDPPFVFPPGQQHDYCNTGYHLLGMTIERLRGKSYRDCLEEQIAGPLGLLQTSYLNHSPIVPGRASGYEFRRERLRNAPYLSMRLPYAAGSLGSTVCDLLAWRRALDGGKVVSAASLVAMQTEHPLASGAPTPYGYGVVRATFDESLKLTHTGGINGFASVLSRYPADDLTIAILVNLGTAEPWALDSEIARLVLGRPAAVAAPHTLTDDQLGDCAGTYEASGQEVEVTVADGGLMAMGQRYDPLDDLQFIASDDPERSLVFHRRDGQVRSVRSSREGIGMELRRRRDGDD